MNTEYAKKLQDPRWQKKRLEIFEHAGWRCQMCGDLRSTLHVHHSFYDGREPWDYPNGSLTCLCSDCHEAHHVSKHGNGADYVPKVQLDLARDVHTQLLNHYHSLRADPRALRACAVICRLTEEPVTPKDQRRVVRLTKFINRRLAERKAA